MPDAADRLYGRPAHRHGGIACMLLALLSFSALDTGTRYVSATVPLVMALWWRYVVQTSVTFAVLWPRRGARLLHTEMPRRQVLRGLLLLSCSGLAFLSLRVMQVGEFTAITMLTPLLLTVIAAVRLGEQVSWLRWLCVLGGFTGSLLVIRPGHDLFHWGSLLPLVLVVANTAFQTLTSRMSRTEDPGTMHFYTGAVGLVVTTVLLPFVWQALPLRFWLVLLLMSGFGMVGHLLLIVAYARAPVAVLTPYLYLQIAFAASAAWLVFSHVPDSWALLGIGLVASCGVFGTWLTGREILAGRRRDAPQSSIAAIAGADAN